MHNCKWYSLPGQRGLSDTELTGGDKRVRFASPKAVAFDSESAQADPGKSCLVCLGLYRQGKRAFVLF